MSPCVPSSYNATAVAAAAAIAATADAVVLVVGTGVKFAGEGHDASNISFPAAQAALIAQVAAAATVRTPVIVVTITASALDIAPILANPRIGAVLHAGEPADSSAGVADLIFGRTVPAGRTVETIYENTWQDSISILDMGMRPGPSDFPRPDCQPPRAGQPPCPNATNPGRPLTRNRKK